MMEKKDKKVFKTIEEYHGAAINSFDVGVAHMYRDYCLSRFAALIDKEYNLASNNKVSAHEVKYTSAKRLLNQLKTNYERVGGGGV